MATPATAAKTAAPSTSAPAPDNRVQRIQEVLKRHEDVVMLVQRVLCWNAPLLTIPYALTLHVIWYLLAFSESSFLSLVCKALCVVALVDLITTSFRSTLYNLLINTERGLAAEGPTHAQARLVPFHSHIQLRTFDEICVALASLSSSACSTYHSWLAVHSESPGKISFVAGVVFILLANIFSWFSGVTISYLCVLAVLTFPALERCSEVRRQVAFVAGKCNVVVEPASIVLNKIFKRIPANVIVVKAPDMSETMEADEAEALKGILEGSAFGSDLDPVQMRKKTTKGSTSSTSGNAPGKQGSSARTSSDADEGRPRGWSVLYDSQLGVDGGENNNPVAADIAAAMETSTTNMETSAFEHVVNDGPNWNLLYEDEGASTAVRRPGAGLRQRNVASEANTQSTPLSKVPPQLLLTKMTDVLSPIRGQEDEVEDEGFTLVN